MILELPVETAADAKLQTVRELYDQGLMLQAHRAGLALGPLHSWPGTEGQILAGRLAGHLGAMRQSAWLLRCAYRNAPDDPEARYYYGYGIWRRRGPYAAWRWLQATGEPPVTTTDELRSSWCALVGEVAATLRDFDTAETWLARAATIAPDSAWVKVCASQVLEGEDRYEEALAQAREALAVRPFYRPAVQSAAHLLTLLERDGEALDLLAEASDRIESNAVTGQLFGMQLELKQYEAASRTLDRFVELTPLPEKVILKWLAAQRAELAYFLGDLPASIRLARESDSEFWKTIADRLDDPARAAGKAVLLPVGFVRQHHVTCGPATLAAITRFWSMPADHLQVADEICYNGTPHHSERKWANDHGWLTREFSVTEPAAIALLDRGIPFTFTTVDPANSHLQAIIGYDSRRGTLLVRDPYWRHSGEALADKLLERYRAYGPRGMALVPVAEGAKLADLDLPDAALWDLLFAVDDALVVHRRELAQQAYDQLRAAAPGHRLGAEGRRRLAVYDSNPTEHLAALDELLAIAPDDQSLILERLACLRNQARREERLEIYRQLCAKKETHPVFWQQYAQELRPDARRHEDALRLLGRAIRRWPTEAANYYILANFFWDQRRFDEALTLYRFAASLGDKDEQLVEGYFNAASWFKQTDEAFAFLRDRVVRFGKKSSQPARTLANAFLQLDRNREALEVIEAALLQRPDDGQLLLFAADLWLACSQEHLPRAVELLERARDKAPRQAWLRTAARMAHTDSRHEDSLALWREALALQPLAIDAHRAIARLLAETEGPAAALAHLEQSADRFPHHYPLHELWIEWVRDEPAAVREPVIRRVVAVNPDDAWIRRELAFLLAAEQRLEEARAEADIAGRLEPTSVSYHLLRAQMARLEGKLPAARDALREAVRLSVDNDLAISELIDLCDTPTERREVLTFVQEQLEAQVIFGDGLLSYRDHARRTLAPDELLADLREALAARPDLWHAWSACVQQLLDMNDLDEARKLSEQATERFPLLPRLWLDRAEVCHCRKDWAGELEALQNVYRISPRWGTGVRALAAAWERRGEYEESRLLLENAVARSPLDGATRLMLAETLWHLNQRDEALACVRQVVQVDPGFERAWDCLSSWSDALGCPEQALAAVRELTARRGGETRSWLFLARLLDAPEQLEEKLQCLAKAAELNPRCSEAYDQRAVALARAGRFDDALAECRPAAWGSHPPRELRARAAWVEAERGDLPAAIAAIKQVVADEPQFFWAWSRLADWCQAAKDNAGYLEASEALVRINPQYEVGHGYLGEARQIAGDRAGAMVAYRHAFELNPKYEFAGNALFDLQLEDGDLTGAAATVQALLDHGESPYVLARDAQLAARQGDQQRALARLASVCTAEAPTEWPVEAAATAAAQAGWKAAAAKTLASFLDRPEARPNVGIEWVVLCGELGDWHACGERLAGMSLDRELVERAVYVFLEGMYKSNRPDELRQYVRRHWKWLRTSTFAWGAAGYALTGIRDYALAAQWNSDWREREDIRSWMLVNVVEGLRNDGRDAEAADASRQALGLPQPKGHDLHRLWLATDAVAAGDMATAQEWLAGMNPAEQLDADYAFLAGCARVAVEMAAARPELASSAFRQARGTLIQLRNGYEFWRFEPARRRAWQAAVRRVAALRGTLLAKWWSWFAVWNWG
ncbi:MAG: tetratricopeptide repeat protein [Pirellulaceae bacterium]|nr:tetratricopeptide repeat protein [Pirellulaceae bacterium]